MNHPESMNDAVTAIAHEIKNPLSVAMANLTLLQGSDEKEDIKKYASIIEKELYRINQLVVDFIHVGMADEHMELFDLSELLNNLVSEYRWRYETITFCREPDLPPVMFWGSKKSIRMVFTNILNNSVEELSQEGIIEIIQVNKAGSVHITFNDNGGGFPQRLLDSPNEIFTTKSNGAGFGLRYCRSTIAGYGGKFLLRNRLGGGCSAIIKLPLKGTKKWLRK